MLVVRRCVMVVCVLLMEALTLAATPVPTVRFTFDEGRGDVATDSAGNRAAKLSRGPFGPLWGEGVQKGALWFSSDVDEAVALPHRAALDATDELTISVCVWPRRFGDFQTIVWKGDRRPAIDRINYRLSLRPDGRPEFTFKGPQDEWYQLGGPEPVPAGRWSHIVAVFQRGTARLLVNGKCVAEGRMNVYAPPNVKVETWRGDRMIPNDLPLIVGRGEETEGDPGQCFLGAIDELSIWTTALASLPATPAFPAEPPLAKLLLWEKSFTAADLAATPYLVGQVNDTRPGWFFDIDFPGCKGRGARLPGQTDGKGQLRYLLNDFCGPIELRDAPAMVVRAYRHNAHDTLTLRDMRLEAGQPTAQVLVQPQRNLQRIRDFGAYADVPLTFADDPATQQALYDPVLAELREVGLTHLDFSVVPQSIEPRNDDADPRHINWDAFRQSFQSDPRMRVLVKFVPYVQSRGFTVGLRFIDYAGWQWVTPAGKKRQPDVDEVAENAVAMLTLLREAKVNITHLVPIWEPSYDPDVVADVCAQTARRARQHGIDTPIVGPYKHATGGQTANVDAVPDRYNLGRLYVEAYMRRAGDVCDFVGVEDYAAGCSMIEPNLKRLWREVIKPLNQSGRPKELWMIEYGTPCGVGPWNFYPSRWHGTYATYESAFRLARCLHQQASGGVSKFMFWKAYDVIGDSKLISCLGLVKGPQHDFERRPPYYIGRMFWKHILPGSRHVVCSSDGDLLANAFLLDRRYTVVMTNPRPTPVAVSVRLEGLSLAPQADFYTSTDAIKYQQTEVLCSGDRVATLTLPPRSVNTLVGYTALPGTPYERTIEAQPGTVYLSDLSWSAVSTTNHGETITDEINGQNVNVFRDENARHDWIVLARTRYRKGLGMSTPGKVTFELDGKYARFQATVGFDDAAGSVDAATTEFEVQLDGKKVYGSGPIKPGAAPQKVQVPCAGAKRLTLLVGETSSKRPGLVAWGDAQLEPAR